ncbi:DUF1707 SHOCT-like domain-containing protein [Antrihabitans spumae]|uniref:DUF1707 domain-containing protein n=1 Tax=Antrihabitans spumae TaxID=3373370 RepID=A0ABW7JLA4_9NOCA
MPMTPIRHLRARDIDRAIVCTALDNAYSDGQLSFEEHRSRIGKARAAVTLTDLKALVSDLQASVDLPPAQSTVRLSSAQSRGRTPLIVAGAVGVVALVVGTVLVASRGSDDDPAPAASAASSTSSVVATTTVPVPSGVVPIVAPKTDFTTAAGISSFRDLYRERFGDTIADEVDMYPDGIYAVMERGEGEPNRMRRWTFQGGFSPGDLEARKPDQPVIDLAAVDVEALVRLIADAPAAIGVADAKISHIGLRTDGGGPAVYIYLNNSFNEGGYIRASFTGEILRISK